MLHGPPRWRITLQSLPLECSSTLSPVLPKKSGHLRRFPLAVAPDIAVWHPTSGPRSTPKSVVQPPAEAGGHDSLLSWALSAKKRPGTHPVRRPDEHLGTSAAVETTAPMPRQPMCEHTHRPDPTHPKPEGIVRTAPPNPKAGEVSPHPHRTPRKAPSRRRPCPPFQAPLPPSKLAGCENRSKEPLSAYGFSRRQRTLREASPLGEVGILPGAAKQ